VTEDRIKRNVVQYLKSYYKYRPRYQNDETLAPTLAQMDMMTSNGIFADGHISFLDESGKLFVATVEASAAESAFEVKYRLEKKLLFWDAIAVAALLVAFLYAYISGFHYAFLKQQQGGVVFASIVFTFLIINILCRFGLRKMERYRSIFAIEQFKQYFADEQWIAIGNDTFAPTEDNFLQELKKQCVFNGFGLLKVDDNDDTHLLITPAREVVYGKKRKKVPFFTAAMENNYTQKAVTWSQEQTQRITAPITEHSLLRFNKRYYKQWFLTSLAGLLFVVSFAKYMQDTPVLWADKDQEKTMDMPKIAIPEEEGYDDSIAIRPFRATKNNTLITTTEPSEKIAEDGVYMMTDDGTLNFYDCERLQPEGKNYVIMESRQPNFQSAKAKLDNLRANGINATAVWLGCFQRNNLSYVIFFDLIYNDKQEAAKKSVEIYNLLKNKGLDASKVKIISLTNQD
jgi:hypothetical protein